MTTDLSGLAGAHTLTTVPDAATVTIDVARWLVANRPAMPVLLASGHVGELMRTGEKPLDDIRVLRKPYSRLELARALRHALER